MITGKLLALVLAGLLAAGGAGAVLAGSGSSDGFENMRQIDLRKDEATDDEEVDDRDDADKDKDKKAKRNRDRSRDRSRGTGDTGGTAAAAQAAPAPAPTPQAAPAPAPRPAAPAYSDDGNSWSGGGSS